MHASISAIVRNNETGVLGCGPYVRCKHKIREWIRILGPKCYRQEDRVSPSARWSHCALCPRCANCNNVIFALIVVFVRSVLYVVLSVLGQLSQWCKLCLMCLRIVLAVTTLLIIIFVLVIVMSSVIIAAELSTYVMCSLFYHNSIFLSIRKHKYIQRMQGSGPRMQGQLYQPRYLTGKDHPKNNCISL